MSTNNHLEMLIKKRLNRNLIIQASAHAAEEKILIQKKDLLEITSFLTFDPDASLDLLLDIFCLEHNENSKTCQWSHHFSQTFFEIFYLLRSSKLGYRLSIHILLDESDPSLPSLSSLYSSANWLERELWDMFGIQAEGHPHLTRLIMYNGFAGHPMKHAYPITKEQALVPIYKQNSRLFQK